MTSYLLYARTRHEFEAVEELAALGIVAECGRVLTCQRKGKKRTPDWYETPALPNYMLAEMDADQFHASRSAKWLAPTRLAMCRADARLFRRFLAEVQRQYDEADRMRQRGVGVRTEYRPGDSLQFVLGHQLADKLAMFRRLVERAHDTHPLLELDVDGWRVLADPLDVKRAV